MNLFLTIGIFIVIFILLIVTGVYAVKAAIAINKNPAVDNDPDLKKAHTHLKNASIVCWIGVFLLVVMIGLYLYFGLETARSTAGTIATILMVTVIILLVSVGILSAIGAAALKSSKAYSDQGSDADGHKWATTAAILGILLVGLSIVGAIIYFVTKSRAKARHNKAEKIRASNAAKNLELKNFAIQEQLKRLRTPSVPTAGPAKQTISPELLAQLKAQLGTPAVPAAGSEILQNLQKGLTSENITHLLQNPQIQALASKFLMK